MKTLLKNAKLIDGKVKDVFINGSVIEKIADQINKEADVEYDLTGKILIPGCIDAHVHLRTPGYEEKEDWTTGSKAALAGGFTTVFDMPNTDPSTTTVKNLENKRAIIRDKALVNYGLFFGAGPHNYDECMAAKGIVGFKVYMGATTGHEVKEDIEKSGEVLERMLKNTNKIVAIHAEDESLMQKHSETYKGDNTPEVHSLIRSDEIAFTAAKKAIHIAKKTRGRMHLCHMSTKKEVNLIKKFKSDKITCEVAPHHLFLAVRDYVKLGNFIKVNPPVRGQHDQDILWRGLNEGVITIIASDHAPHLREEKERPYDQAPSGIPELETSLALMLNAVNDERIDIETVVDLMCKKPARLYGLHKKGEVREGFDADLTVIDMNLMREVSNERLYTKCGWSPYDGWQLKGWPVMTFVNGVLGMKDNEIVESTELKGIEVDVE